MTDVLEQAPEVRPPAIAEPAADQRLAKDRFDIQALVAKADHRFLAGDRRAAASFYAFAVKVAGRGVARQLDSESAKHALKMREWLAQRFRHYILDGLEEAGFTPGRWPARLQTALAIMFGDRPRDLVTERFPQLPTLFYYPGLPSVDFADVGMFPWREELEARYQEMRAEAQTLLADTSDFAPYVTSMSDRPEGGVDGLRDNADWSSLHLWGNGAPVEQNAARCPATFEAITGIVPLCKIGRVTPTVLFSLLKPGAHIPPHTGMLNIHYICHLPLIVPPNCSFRVGEKTVQWEEGRLLAFDDTVEHEARNDSDRDRLVLIFDVWNPHLAEEERLMIARLLELADDYR